MVAMAIHEGSFATRLAPCSLYHLIRNLLDFCSGLGCPLVLAKGPRRWVNGGIRIAGFAPDPMHNAVSLALEPVNFSDKLGNAFFVFRRGIKQDSLHEVDDPIGAKILQQEFCRLWLAAKRDVHQALNVPIKLVLRATLAIA
jgi:hypothetical protein